MTTRIAAALFVLGLYAVPSIAFELPYPRADRARPQGPAGTGPFLGSLPAPPIAPAPKRSQETWVDLPCDVFDPGKADPANWMATSTIAKVTYDGFTYQYGYDPLAQSYDMLVSGLASQQGILVQETVGVMAAPLPPVLSSSNILRVEAWFLVESSNLFPFEFVGITQLSNAPAPSSSLDIFGMESLYTDARGFSGDVYFLDHLATGPHALDLGPIATADLASRVDDEGWFGVGFAADGWDLSGSLGEMVSWTVSGGGGLPVANRPFFRVYYNAPPDAAQLTWPADGQAIGTPEPTLQWQRADDPNGDTPVTYTLRLGSDPNLGSAFEMGVGADTRVTIPFPLGAGVYYWEIVSQDPGGETNISERWSMSVQPTSTAPLPMVSTELMAHPNPFNPRTVLRFELAHPADVDLWITDLRGRRVQTLHQGRLAAGSHGIHWNGTDHLGRSCASGVYRAVLQTGDQLRSTPLSLLK